MYSFGVDAWFFGIEGKMWKVLTLPYTWYSPADFVPDDTEQIGVVRGMLRAELSNCQCALMRYAATSEVELSKTIPREARSSSVVASSMLPKVVVP
jgi:hypothetical protein